VSTRAMMAGLVLLFLASGCSHPGSGLPNGSFERGKAEYEGERYYDAIESLKLFVRRSPTDARVDEAQYMIGMARFDNEEYPVAAVEFEILRTDYPNSDLVEDAWLMEGLCYVEQVPSIHLEQSITRRALEHYQRFLREMPASDRRGEAQEKIDELQLHLDRKTMAGIRLYDRLGRDRAALVSVDAMLDERRDSALRADALLLAGDLHEELDELPEARARWQQVVDEFGMTSLAPEALRRLERTRGEAGAR